METEASHHLSEEEYSIKQKVLKRNAPLRVQGLYTLPGPQACLGILSKSAFCFYLSVSKVGFAGPWEQK